MTLDTDRINKKKMRSYVSDSIVVVLISATGKNQSHLLIHSFPRYLFINIHHICANTVRKRFKFAITSNVVRNKLDNVKIVKFKIQFFIMNILRSIFGSI